LLKIIQQPEQTIQPSSVIDGSHVKRPEGISGTVQRDTEIICAINAQE
jgi:hypothetical protein